MADNLGKKAGTSRVVKGKAEKIEMPEIPVEPVCGGIIYEKSDCCGASIVYPPGGIRIPRCSKCSKLYEPRRYSLGEG